MDKQIFLNQLLTEQKQLKNEIDALNETLRALDILVARYSGSKTTNISKPSLFNDSEPPLFNDYTIKLNENSDFQKNEFVSKRSSAEDRVIGALDYIGSGTASQVAEILLKLYPDLYTKEKAKNTAKVKLSNLNNEGKITGTKIEGSNSFLYKLKK